MGCNILSKTEGQLYQGTQNALVLQMKTMFKVALHGGVTTLSGLYSLRSPGEDMYDVSV